MKQQLKLIMKMNNIKPNSEKFKYTMQSINYVNYNYSCIILHIIYNLLRKNVIILLKKERCKMSCVFG